MRDHHFFASSPFAKDRFIPARLRAKQEIDIQMAKFEGMFDEPEYSVHSDSRAHEVLGMSAYAIHDSSTLNFHMKPSVPIKPSVPKLPKKKISLELEFIRGFSAQPLIDDYYSNLLCWGKHVYIGLQDDLYVINYQTGEKRNISSGNQIYALACNSSLIMRADLEGGIRIIKEDTYEIVRQIYRTRSYSSAVFADDNSLYMSCNALRGLSFYDTRTPQLVMLPYICESKALSVSYQAANYKLALSTDNLVYLFDSRRMDIPVHQLAGHGMHTSKALAFSPDKTAEYIATGGGNQDKTLKIWSTLTGKKEAEAFVGGQVCNIHWLTEGNVFVTEGFSNNKVSCWKKEDNELKFESTPKIYHTNRVLYAAQNPLDRNQLATAAPAENLLFWSVKNNVKQRPKPAELFASYGSYTIR